MSIVGSLELGELAKQVKEGAITAAEFEERKQAVKRAEEKEMSWIQRNWKKVALGVGGTALIGGGVYAASKTVKGLGEGLKGLMGIFSAPMEMFAKFQEMLQFDPSKWFEGFDPSKWFGGGEAPTSDWSKGLLDFQKLFGFGKIFDSSSDLGVGKMAVDISNIIPKIEVGSLFEPLEKVLGRVPVKGTDIGLKPFDWSTLKLW